MMPPDPADMPGLTDEARDRSRVADTTVPIAERLRIAFEWESLWSWAVAFAAGIEEPRHRSNAIAFYSRRLEWWCDALSYLAPEFERAQNQ